MTRPEVAPAPSDEPVTTASPRRRRGWSPWAAAATAVLVTGLAAAWWFFWTTPVVYPGGFGATISGAEPGGRYAIGLDGLCLDGPERAVIDDVTVDGVGLVVTDFAVRERSMTSTVGPGAGPGESADTDGGDGRGFSGQCDDGAKTELTVELSLAGDGPAHAETVDLHWTAGLRSGVLRTPVTVTLCPTGDTSELCSGGL
jgi:hypothetical protein